MKLYLVERKLVSSDHLLRIPLGIISEDQRKRVERDLADWENSSAAETIRIMLSCRVDHRVIPFNVGKVEGLTADSDERVEVIRAARDLYADGSGDDIEVDSDAIISRVENGTWVQMWGWVPGGAVK